MNCLSLYDVEARQRLCIDGRDLHWPPRARPLSTDLIDAANKPAPTLSTYERLRDTERSLKQEDKQSSAHLRAALAFINRKR